MQGNLRCIAVAACLWVAPATVAAEPVAETVYQRKAWEVQIVAFDDGTISCVAQVSDGGESFSLWATAEDQVKLQFYSDVWDFEGGTANLEVQIDRRAPWELTNAELYMQSVLFNMPPDAEESIRFVTEVMRGNALALRNEDGSHVQSYSLAGSSASIQALIECVEVLEADPSNPFQ